jgi:hypothetical protein
MPNCENCTLEHDGSYGSGRFCNAKCARAFSTKADRQAISQRVSQALIGRKVGGSTPPIFTVRPETADGRRRISEANISRTTKILLAWVIPWSLGQVEPKGYRMVRRGLIHLRGEKCEICGWAEKHPISGSIPLHVHHKDGDHRNNGYNNLELLCPNHHSLTENFSAYNIASFKVRNLGAI